MVVGLDLLAKAQRNSEDAAQRKTASKTLIQSYFIGDNLLLGFSHERTPLPVILGFVLRSCLR